MSFFTNLSNSKSKLEQTGQNIGIIKDNRIILRSKDTVKMRIWNNIWHLKSYKLTADTTVSILTHWVWVTHICVTELTTIGSDNGLSPGWCQAVIWNNAGLLLIEPLGTNFSDISMGIQTFLFKKMHLNMSSAKWRPFCPSLNVLSIKKLSCWESYISLITGFNSSTLT